MATAISVCNTRIKSTWANRLLFSGKCLTYSIEIHAGRMAAAYRRWCTNPLNRWMPPGPMCRHSCEWFERYWHRRVSNDSHAIHAAQSKVVLDPGLKRWTPTLRKTNELEHENQNILNSHTNDFVLFRWQMIRYHAANMRAQRMTNAGHLLIWCSFVCQEGVDLCKENNISLVSLLHELDNESIAVSNHLPELHIVTPIWCYPTLTSSMDNVWASTNRPSQRWSIAINMLKVQRTHKIISSTYRIPENLFLWM